MAREGGLASNRPNWADRLVPVGVGAAWHCRTARPAPTGSKLPVRRVLPLASARDL